MVDFDSAIPRFESWHPSQPVRSLRCDFQVWENRRHSRGLAGNGRVFGEENRALPTEVVRAEEELRAWLARNRG